MEMAKYPYLPGVRLGTLDGNTRVSAQPQSKATLVVGTSGKGPAEKTYSASDPSAAANLFGLDGTLIKAMHEVLMHSDNVKLFRIGTAPAVLNGIGKTATEAGFKLTLGERSADAATRYKIYYANGALYLYLDGELVLASDPAASVAIDTGDSVLEGAATAGLFLAKELGTAFQATHAYAVGDMVKPAAYTGLNYKCTVAGDSGAAEPEWVDVLGQTTISGGATFVAVNPSEPLVENAITIDAAVKLAAQGTNAVPTLVAAKDGLGMTLTETYEALDQALDLLQIEKVDQIICPNGLFDAPNVAFYVPTDPTTAKNNPAVNDALGWLKTTVDEYGQKTYSWAHKDGTIFTSAADRVAKGYHEVNFGYLLAKFAAAQQAELGGCLAGVATGGPKAYNNATVDKFDLVSLRNWIGVAPKYNDAGQPISNGKGLLGIPYLSGCTVAKLNPLCHEYANGVAYRMPGFYENESGEYDGGVSYDKNNQPIDIGAYLLVWGDTQFISNSYAYQYAGNLLSVVMGYLASLDEKKALTYKTLNGVTQVWFPNFGMMNALSKAKIGALRGDEKTPTIIHDNSAASLESDWSQIYRTRLKFLIAKIAFTTGKKFLGTNAINGLQLTSMETALNSDGDELKKRGYITGVQYAPYTTIADARIGAVSCDVRFQAPNQARQLNFSLGITRQ
jgi:hypothetical protein